MSKRFGSKRVAGCECTTRFTCGHCLRNAPPYFFTPTSPQEKVVDDMLSRPPVHPMP